MEEFFDRHQEVKSYERTDFSESKSGSEIAAFGRVVRTEIKGIDWMSSVREFVGNRYE